jgi:NADPH-dependent 2,4-dienoyl-CoA reductase/sulfur reductase-like enzyme
MVLADRYPNFSVCGLPFYVSGEVEDWRALAHRGVEEISRQGVELLVEHQATHVEPDEKRVSIRDGAGRERSLAYDTLVIATGARPRIEGVEGATLPGVHRLHTMMDSFQLRSRLEAGGIDRAVIVGGGYIGLEMADALTHRGVRVSLVGRSPSVMPRIDPSLGARPGRARAPRNAGGQGIRPGRRLHRVA